VQRGRASTRWCADARIDIDRSGFGAMNAQLGRKMRAALIAIDCTARNVEVGRCETDELELVARVCDELARALRAHASPTEIDGAVIESPHQR
jgi:hypothetical protein